MSPCSLLRALRLPAAIAAAIAPVSIGGAAGGLDAAFNPAVNSYPNGIGVQPDGKIVVTGWFSKVGGVPRSGIARIDADGALDAGFDPAADGTVMCVGIQADGKILIGGEFIRIDGVYHVRIARLNADGSPEAGFVTNASLAVTSATPLEDGKILVSGNLNAIDGVDRWKVARLNPDGSLDDGFPNPRLNAQAWTHVVQPDGRILVGGAFDTVAGNAQTRVARLNADGSHDPSFANPSMQGSVYAMVLQPDGMVVIAGTFTKVGGVTRNRIARLHPNGMLDSSYSPGVDEFIDSMALQADGKLIIGGRFSKVNGVSQARIARLHPDGSLDLSLAPVVGAVNDTVVSAALQEDGKLLIGGNFGKVNGTAIYSFARLLNDPASQELTVPSGERVQWLRGGSSPEVDRVSFDLSTDGGATWTGVARGTRIAGGWEAAGMRLTGDGLIRARGFARGGFYNGGSSLFETRVSFSFPPPGATTLAATGITGVGATLHGGVNARRSTTSVAFEYGETDAYGSMAAATPASVAGDSDTPVSAQLSGLLPGTSYHYRVTATNPTGTTVGEDMSFTTLSDNARLAGLGLSSGALAPGFEKFSSNYVATVPYATASVMVTPTTDHPGATVKINGVTVASGAASAPVNLPVGNTTITTVVTAEDLVTTRTYTLTVTRLPLEFVFDSAADVPVSAHGFSTGGLPAVPVLNYPPLPGTVLTMVDNTGNGFIDGRFGNLSQGQRVTLGYGGESYGFVANYFGGSGNDLVLQWAATRVLSWGDNGHGQLGDGSTDGRLVPTDISDSPLLSGRTVTAVSSGYLHSLALCSDGTLAAWGYNVYGQLGDGSAAQSNVPVEVDQTGVLVGRTLVAVSAGPFHNLALCSDGTVVSWGYNNYGQLGTGDTITNRVPVLVKRVGALVGRQVVAVAAAAYHSFALCSDGTVVAWGYNDEGELGDGTTTGAMVPVAVDGSGILAGREVAAISAGQYHALALCADGTVASWGYNARGQLGNGSTASSNSPVDIGASGVLAGRSVAAVRAGGSHSLALCSDGTLAAWGDNRRRQLGGIGVVQSTIPVAVNPLGDAAGKSVAAVEIGRNHNLMRFADGGMAGFGENANGQLGNNDTTTSGEPSAVDAGVLGADARFMFAAHGSAAYHSLAVAGVPTAAARQPVRVGGSGVDAIGGDLDDPDHDGIPNLMEHAFGLDPLEHSAGGLPQGRIVGRNFVIRFSKPAGISGILYGAEWSATLEPGSWQEVPDSGSGDTHTFSMPLDTGPRLFMRLKVTAADRAP